MSSDITNGELLLGENKKNTAGNAVLYVLVVVLCGLFIFFYLFTSTVIEGKSMENTLNNNQCVMLQYHGFTVERGDIVTIDVGKSDPLIKRIVAVGGDRLLFVEDKNGKNVNLYIRKNKSARYELIQEPYIKEKMSKNGQYGDVSILDYVDETQIVGIDFTKTEFSKDQSKLVDIITECEITVPEHNVYFMGDNRNNSTDARVFGARPSKDILAKLIYAPTQGTTAEKFIRFIFD